MGCSACLCLLGHLFIDTLQHPFTPPPSQFVQEKKKEKEKDFGRGKKRKRTVLYFTLTPREKRNKVASRSKMASFITGEGDKCAPLILKLIFL